MPIFSIKQIYSIRDMHCQQVVAKGMRALDILKPSSNNRLLSTTNSSHKSIDCHTHMYTPKYMDILHNRTSIPRVSIHNGIRRLIILPDEDKETTTSAGRVIGREYWDVKAKIAFMDNHGIEKSIISLANPWLGKLP